MNVSVACVALLSVTAFCAAAAEEPSQVIGKPFEIKLTSSVDGTEQPAIVQVPLGYTGQEKTPLLVGLHTWSGNYKQQVKAMTPQTNTRGWLLVLPNFRGPNVPGNPHARQACASILAQRDIIDAVNHMKATYAVDESRVYLIGASGGGHMSMQMAGKYPDVWAGVSAWVGITDLRLWQQENRGYARGVHACCGGKPGDSPEVDWEYVRRSPITFIQNASHTWLDLQHGRKDGSVPFHHTVDAHERVSKVPGNRARLTVFDGGHTIKYREAFDWVAKQTKDPNPPKTLWLTTDEAKGYFYAYLVPAAPMQLGRCEIEIAADGKVSLKTEGLSEVRLDAVAAGMAPCPAMTLSFTGDDQCGAVLLTNVGKPTKVEKGGAAAKWTYDEAEKTLRLSVKGEASGEWQLAW